MGHGTVSRLLGGVLFRKVLVSRPLFKPGDSDARRFRFLQLTALIAVTTKLTSQYGVMSCQIITETGWLSVAGHHSQLVWLKMRLDWADALTILMHISQFRYFEAQKSLRGWILEST